MGWYRVWLVLALGAAGPARAADPVVATVGKTQISAGELQAQVEKLPGKQPHQVLELLIARELLRLEGEAQGLGADPQLRAELDQYERQELLRLIEEREVAAGRFSEGQTVRHRLGAALRDSLGFVWDTEVARGLVGRQHARATAADSVALVARWQGGSLTVAEYLKRSLIYGVRNSLVDTAAAHKAGEQLTLDDLLVAWARQRGYDQDPVLVHRRQSKEAELWGQMLFFRQVEAEGPPSDSLQRAYFGQHRDRFILPPGVKVQEILVDDFPLADSLRTQILAGADMGELAKVHTRRRWARESGGDLGLLTLKAPGYGELLPVAFAAEPGQLQGPVQQGGVFALFRVTERIAPRPATFEEARTGVMERLQEEGMDRYISQLRVKYARKIHVDEQALGE
ncbi:MAG: peptidyl-prolyl cis-trans isomerase [Candidatus Latescibacteria bacterium]|nr:peptidyl-prolyl cis-trans isomerase [Candidatus Latescibacterota bacterium]